MDSPLRTLIMTTCPAKINLTLNVIGKRADGYHDIVSLIDPLSFCDVIRISVTEEGGGGKDKRDREARRSLKDVDDIDEVDIRVVCETPGVPESKDNLVVKAARALLIKVAKKGITRRRVISLLIEIDKKIPVAAGLGGGSSDAAGVLTSLNKHWGYPLSSEELKETALEIGSDVPFFLPGGAQIATGRGDELKSVKVPKFSYVLVNPGFFVSAGWTYDNLSLTKKDEGNILSDLVECLDGSKELLSILGNDLEAPVLAKYPELTDVKKALLDVGARVALISGSGPTVFGVFLDDEAAESASDKLKKKLGKECRIFTACGSGH